MESLRLPIDRATFDQGICHLYAHALIDRVLGGSTTSLREEDVPVIERYFLLLAEGCDRGVAIRKLEGDCGRIPSGAKDVRRSVMAPVAPVPALRPREDAGDLRSALEDEVERAVARARDRLRLELHETCGTMAADAERVAAKQGIEMRARVDAAAREAVEAIATAGESASDRLVKAALAELESRVEATTAEAATAIAGIRRFESDEVHFAIRDAGDAAIRKAQETIERKIGEGEKRFRETCEAAYREKEAASLEIVRVEIKARADGALTAIGERSRIAMEEIVPSIRTAGVKATVEIEETLKRRAVSLGTELEEIASRTSKESERVAGALADCARLAIEEFKPAVAVEADEAATAAIERIGSSADAAEERVRLLAESEVRGRISSTIEESLAGARAKIEGQYLENAHASIQAEIKLAEERLADRIDLELGKFETRIRTCFELARSVNDPAPPRTRIESFHAFLSGLADLLWPLWSIIAGPGRVYAQRQAVAEKVVVLPSAIEREKAA